MSKERTMGRKFLAIILTVFVAIGMLAVSTTDTFAASKLTIKPSSKSIAVGQTVTLKSNKSVKWSISSGSKYVKLSSKAKKSVKVKGLKKGTAVVKAKAGSKTKKVTIKVYSALTISPSSKSITVDQTTTLKTNNTAKWSISAGKDIIKLSSVKSTSAVVTGLKAGNGTVKVIDSKTGVTKYAKITVTAKQEESKTDPEPDTETEPDPQPEEEFEPETATVAEVTAMMNDSDENTELVDARPQEAYAGWALQGAKNGGHLKNAILYSARWLDFEISSSKREKKLASYNTEIGLSGDKTYIVYDYTDSKSEAVNVAKYFYKQGAKNVKVFDAKDLIDNGSNLESYKNYDYYLPSEIVKDISDYKTGKDDTLEPETTAVISKSDIDKVILIDVSYGNVHESSYLSTGHVPGAIHMNTNEYERPRSYTPEKREKYSVEYSLIPLDEFRDEVCTEYGITKDSIVIGISSDGRPIGRLGYMLRSLGVKYYGMSGLMNAWNYNGYKLDTTNVVKPTSVDSFGSDTIANPNELAWMDEVKEILKKNGEDENDHTAGTVVGSDNLTSTYSYHDLYGKIPGTLNAKGGTFENVDGTPVMQQLLVNFYKTNNIPTDKPIIHFCGDGWGAARDAYNAQSVDMDNVRAWGEGWVVWSNRGNWFIDYTGRKVKYDKYLDEIVDTDGNVVTDSKIMKSE